MADLVPVAASVRDASPFGMSRKIDLIAGVAITAGQAVYCNSSGLAALADASAAGTAVVLGVALETVSVGQSVPILMDGWIDGLGVSALAYETRLKLSDTAGGIDNGAGSPTVLAPMGRVLPATDGALTKLVLLNCSYNLNVIPA